MPMTGACPSNKCCRVPAPSLRWRWTESAFVMKQWKGVNERRTCRNKGVLPITLWRLAWDFVGNVNTNDLNIKAYRGNKRLQRRSVYILTMGWFWGRGSHCARTMLHQSGFGESNVETAAVVSVSVVLCQLGHLFVLLQGVAMGRITLNMLWRSPESTVSLNYWL